MKVIGTELYDKGFDSLIEDFMVLLKSSNDNLLISPSDANVLVNARTNLNFKRVLDQFYWNLPDGVPSVWVMKLKGSKTVSQCSGPEFFKKIIVETADMPVNHYLCGGAKGVSDNLKKVCNKWGNNNIVGTLSPPYKPINELNLKDIEYIRNNNSDLVDKYLCKLYDLNYDDVLEIINR